MAGSTDARQRVSSEADARQRVTVEADGGSRGNPGPAAFGAVLKDADTGEVIAEASESIGTATNNVAEYRGLIAGLELLRRHAPDVAEIEVRMDSKLVIEQMAGRWRIKHPGLKPLAIQANSLAPEGVTWTWIPRELNREADRLVNEALDRASGRPVENAQDLVTSPAAESLNTLPGWDAELGKPTTLILLRHGSTLHTLAKRFSGSGGDDPGLNDAGKAQAGAAAGWLRGEGRINAVISSPLRRTRETASIVAGSLGLDVELDDDIAEAAFGEWDGHTFAEVRAGWPEQLRAWLGSTDVSPPGGESFADVAVRVHRFRDRVLTERPAETVVVVTHVTPIKLLVRQALEAPLRAIYRMELRPASASKILFYPDGTPSLQLFAYPPPPVPLDS